MFRKIGVVFFVFAALLCLTTISGNTVEAKSDYGMRDQTIELKEASVRLLALPKVSTSKYVSAKTAGDNVRSQVQNHVRTLTVYVYSDISDPTSAYEEFHDQIFRETGDPKQGDYMLWDIDTESPSYTVKTEKKNGSTTYYYTFHVEFTYLTTLTQQAQVDEAIDILINSFGLSDTASEYDKIKAAYDYVCANVSYAKDTESDVSYTSWGALFNNQAVCQGYSQLMYRLLMEMGVSSRVIPGYGTSTTVMHGWNIVQIGDYYYNIDSTWDAERRQDGKAYSYFLKGDDFESHTRLEEYATSQFYAEYPMAARDYGKGTPTASSRSLRATFEVLTPKFKKVSRKKVRLVKVASANKYKVKYTTGKKFGKKTTRTMNAKKTSFRLKNLNKNKTYRLKFRAYTKIDGVRVHTNWSKVKKIKKIKKIKKKK